jgi:hypothetical protein
MRFGILTAVSYEGRSGQSAAWLVRCDCGAEKVVKSTNLKRQQSCGCLMRQQQAERASTHGLTRVGNKHPLYYTWEGLRKRCHGASPETRYGGRGIFVCERWRFGADGKTGLECFISDMGERPSPLHSIDRIDNNGPYSPENCRWATIAEQQRNKSSNRIVTFDGKRMVLIEAIKLSGLNESTVAGRLNRGWSEDAALTNPLTRRARS